MPISARKLVYDTVRKLNGLNTGMGQSFSVLDLVSAINDAYEIIVENNIKLTDTNSIVRDNLRKLEIKNYELRLEKRGDYFFAEYPNNLYKRLNHFAEVKCSGCEKNKIIIPRLVQSDDIHEARKNPYRKANFSWEQLIMDEGSEGLYIYTDNEMDIIRVSIDYYRRINYIEAPSLVECNDYVYLNYDDKLINNDVNFDLDNTYIARKVTDVAVLLLRTDIKDSDAFKLKLESIIQTDKIT
jgi:hypothetical protein